MPPNGAIWGVSAAILTVMQLSWFLCPCPKDEASTKLFPLTLTKGMHKKNPNSSRLDDVLQVVQKYFVQDITWRPKTTAGVKYPCKQNSNSKVDGGGGGEIPMHLDESSLQYNTNAFGWELIAVKYQCIWMRAHCCKVTVFWFVLELSLEKTEKNRGSLAFSSRSSRSRQLLLTWLAWSRISPVCKTAWHFN